MQPTVTPIADEFTFAGANATSAVGNNCLDLERAITNTTIGSISPPLHCRIVYHLKLSNRINALALRHVRFHATTNWRMSGFAG